MTDKKFTDEEIISSLEVIATTCNCNECKIRSGRWGTCNCSETTANAALDLINRQKAEIEQWKEEANRKMAKKMYNFNKYIENYIGKKYDITGNVYELIDYLFISHSLYFQSVNDDSFLILNVDKVNLDEYIK